MAQSKATKKIALPPISSWQKRNCPVGDHFPIVGIGTRIYHNPEYAKNNSAGNVTSKSSVTKYLSYTYLDRESLKAMKDAGINMVQAMQGLSSVYNPSNVSIGVEIPAEMKSESLTNQFLSAYNCNEESIGYLLRLSNPTLDADTEPKTGTINSNGITKLRNWRQNWQKVANAFFSNEAVKGWMFWDEPTANLFSYIGNYGTSPVATIDKWDRLRFVNLLPPIAEIRKIAGATDAELNFDSTNVLQNMWDYYKTYLLDYQSKTKAQVISFDYYPVRRTAKIPVSDKSVAHINLAKDPFPAIPTGKETYVFEPSFIGMLDALRYASTRRNVSFWVHIGVMEYQSPVDMIKDDKTKIDYYEWKIPGVATPEILKFQIYLSLAYGAQGFCYWSMWLRNNNGTEHYLTAPLEIDATNNTIKKTASYEAVKQANEALEKWKYVFLNCNVRYCAPYANVNIPGEMGANVRPFDVNHLTSLIRSCSLSNNNGVLISMLRKDGYDYVAFVNLDFQQATSIKVKFVYDMIDMGPVVDRIYRNNHGDGTQTEMDVTIITSNDDKGTTISLAKGDMKVFRVLNSASYYNVRN